MNFQIFLTVFLLVTAKRAQCDSMLDNLLSQILTSLQSSSTEPPTTKAPIWNPLSWITPKALDIPYNPDSDLTTVRIFFYIFLKNL